MNLFILIAVIVGIATLVFFFSKQKSTPPEAIKLEAEQQKLFDIAMNVENTEEPVMFALTTCRHCRRAATMLEENNVQLITIYIDTFPREAREKLMNKVREYNPRGSFPTIYLPSKNVIIGYREHQIREALIDGTSSNDPTRTS